MTKETIGTIAPALTASANESKEGSCSLSEALDLWAALLRVTNTIHARVSEDLVELGITPEEIELLIRLSRAPNESLRMVEVSRSLLLSKSGVTRLVDRLELRGLVERTSCPEDRRVVYTTLTDQGRQAFDEAGPRLAVAVAEHLGRHLDAPKIAAIRDGLSIVLAAEGDAPPD
jgi:DNA-binding MarR family transcriptional regulator